MPQIGWLELIIIIGLSIVIIGPKDFPKVLNKVGSWIGSTKRYFSDIQNKMTKLEEDVVDDPEDKYSKKNNERVENNND